MAAFLGFVSMLVMIYLVVGLIKPAWVKTKSRKQVFLIFLGVFVLIIILSAVSGEKSSNNQSATNVVSNAKLAEAQKSLEKKQADAQNQIEIHKTPEQLFEEQIKSTTESSDTIHMFQYKGIEFSNADKDKPKGSKQVIIKMDVKNYLSKNSTIRHSGEVASAIFQKAYDPAFSKSLNITDPIVWFFGDIVDKYGNKSNDIWMSYALNKTTFSKINWSNFDAGGLCDFIRSEPSEIFDNVCSIKIQMN